LKKLLSLLALTLITFSSDAQLYTFNKYTHRDGLSMSKINTFEQSDDGYIWLGTDGAALIQYDGNEFKDVQMNNSNKSFHYEDLVVRGDEIYFATSYNGFLKYSRTEGTVTRLDNKKNKIGDGQRIILQDKCIYFLGRLGIIRHQEGKEEIIKTFSNELENGIEQVIETPYGIFATSDEGIFFFNDDRFKELKNAPETASFEGLNNFQFGWFESNTLTLHTAAFDQKIIVKFNKNGSIKSVKREACATILAENEFIVSADFKEKSNQHVLLTNQGRIFTEKNNKLFQIVHNHLETIQIPEEISIGHNGEFWVNSGFSGIFEVSIEPFTKVQLSEIFISPDIGFPLVDGNSIVLSLMTSGTYVGSFSGKDDFRFFPIHIFGSCEIKGTTYLATNDGIKKYVSNSTTPFEDFLETDKDISFIHSDGFDIWYSIRGEGLTKYNIVTKKKTLPSADQNTPKYIYTAQTTFEDGEIYFGTNNGIFKYNKSSKKFSRVKTNKMGSYSGVSATDAYRNLWFTLKNGIIGIVNGKVVSIDISKISSSSVFYTLNADKYGNLIVGTNKGITILKLNANGEVISSQNYSGGTGFDGYETHMRSQFQIGNNIYVGTVEGLFLINTDILENLPPPTQLVIEDNSDEGIEGSREFNLNVNNARIPTIYYRYRIPELGNEWIDLEKSGNIRLYDLSSGDYTLEVAASYDGIVYGDSSIKKFEIDMPIWSSLWFIALIVVLVLLFNILSLVYGNRYDSSRLLSTKDTELHIQMTPVTLLVGVVMVVASHLIGSYFDPSIDMNLGLIFTVGFLIITLFVISLWAKKNGMQYIFKYLLTIGIYITISHFFWELYNTRFHPFHLVGIVLTVSIAPFLLNRIVNTLTFGVVVFLISILCIIFVNDPIYTRINVMIAIISSIGLLIINTYLRYNSLEKLMFISGIINRGNFPVVAYKADGTITYVSENISQFADITHDELLKNKISFLNTFVPFGDKYKEQDATVEFEEGSKYLIPMSDGETVRWMEWSYKRFSENTRVIIGQDVSERIEIQNTYELLVQNVEDMIFRVDINGNFVFLNDTFLERMGYTKEELIGVDSISVVAEEYQEEIAYFYRTHFLERKANSYKEFPIVTKSGETIWIGQHVNTIYTPGTNNHVKGFISLARDMTELKKQQKLILAQRDDITSSISYAQRIQFNLLPNEQKFAEYFDDHFIMFSPKDIVSGDFYWMQKIDNKLVVALGDCTGHGVPGAFMTLLGINLLNNIVLEARLTEPGTILNELDVRLQEYFGARGRAKMTDGMELTICVMDDLQEEIAYACAGSRFLTHTEEGFTLFKGNTEHIGDQKSQNFKGYVTQYTRVGKGDTAYFFTDGFQDQFGGVKNKKYSFRRLLDLFESNVNLSLEDQRMMIEAEFDQWMGNQPQTDDVAVIGIQRKCKKH